MCLMCVFLGLRGSAGLFCLFGVLWVTCFVLVNCCFLVVCFLVWILGFVSAFLGAVCA